MLCSRAYLDAKIAPSTPRLPLPAGTKIPSTSPSNSSMLDSLMLSDSTRLILHPRDCSC